MKNNLAVNPQIEFHFARNAKYLAFNPQNVEMVLAVNPQSVKKFGLCLSVGKSLGISPQNVKMTSLGINPHANLAVIPGHHIIHFSCFMVLVLFVLISFPCYPMTWIMNVGTFWGSNNFSQESNPSAAGF